MLKVHIGLTSVNMLIYPERRLQPLDPVPVGADQPDHGVPHHQDVGSRPQPPLGHRPRRHRVLESPGLDAQLQLRPISYRLKHQRHQEAGRHLVVPAVHQLNKKLINQAICQKNLLNLVLRIH